MEHILQIAIGVDDNEIRKNITENAEKQIKDSIKQDVLNRIFDSRYYRGNADPKNDPLKSWARDVFREILIDHKEEIITAAVANLTDGLKRTKTVKDMLKKMESECEETA